MKTPDEQTKCCWLFSPLLQTLQRSYLFGGEKSCFLRILLSLEGLYIIIIIISLIIKFKLS